MRVGLDATPLLGVRTGIGRYTADLLAALAAGPDELVATAFTLRGRGDLEVPPSVAVRARPVPARLLQEAWARGPFPPVELLTGRPPFQGDSPVAVAYQHVGQEPQRPSEVATDVPDVLDRITGR